MPFCESYQGFGINLLVHRGPDMDTGVPTVGMGRLEARETPLDRLGLCWYSL